MARYILVNAQNIIVAIMFITIIEMILPNNTNKKYIKVISSIYLIVTIINPFLNSLNDNLDNNILNKLETIKTSSDSVNVDIQNYYITSLIDAIKLELKDNGFLVKKVEVKLNSDYSNIVLIKIFGAESNQYDEIRRYIVHNFGVEDNEIIFIS